MQRDMTRQILHSKLARPIDNVLTQSSNVLCRQTQLDVLRSSVRFRHVHFSATKQMGA